MTLQGNEGAQLENYGQSSKFGISQRNLYGHGGNRLGNDLHAELSPTQINARTKARPSTEVGRRRIRGGQEDPSTTAVTDHVLVNDMSPRSDNSKSDNKTPKKFTAP